MSKMSDLDLMVREGERTAEDFIGRGCDARTARAMAAVVEASNLPDRHEPSEDYYFCDGEGCSEALAGFDFVGGLCPKCESKNGWRSKGFGLCDCCELEAEVDQNDCCRSCDAEALEVFETERERAERILRPTRLGRAVVAVIAGEEERRREMERAQGVSNEPYEEHRGSTCNAGCGYCGACS